MSAMDDKALDNLVLRLCERRALHYEHLPTETRWVLAADHDDLSQRAAEAITQLRSERDRQREQIAQKDAEIARLAKQFVDVSAACGCAEIKAEKAEREAAALKNDRSEFMAELMNIANAKRFDRKHFDDDTSFANWAQSRARFALGTDAAIAQDGK